MSCNSVYILHFCFFISRVWETKSELWDTIIFFIFFFHGGIGLPYSSIQNGTLTLEITEKKKINDWNIIFCSLLYSFRKIPYEFTTIIWFVISNFISIVYKIALAVLFFFIHNIYFIVVMQVLSGQTRACCFWAFSFSTSPLHVSPSSLSINHSGTNMITIDLALFLKPLFLANTVICCLHCILGFRFVKWLVCDISGDKTLHFQIRHF